MHILCIGTNHTRAPIDFRERMAFSSEELPGAIRRFLNETPALSEVLILSTCNRTEVYAVTREPMLEIVADRLAHLIQAQKGIEEAEFARYSFALAGRDAVEHFLSVTSGIDSLIIGENQILDQVKEAVSLSERIGAGHMVLENLWQRARRSTKRIRSKKMLSQTYDSVASAAVRLILRNASPMRDKQVMMLGAGKMVQLACEELSKCGAGLTVANRTVERARPLIEKFHCEVISLDEVNAALPRFDVVLSSSGAGGLLLRESDLAQALKARGGRSMLIVDIAVPRNVDPLAAKLNGVELYNIDDLLPMVEEGNTRVRPSIDQVRLEIAKKADLFMNWLKETEIAPTLRTLHAKAERIRNEEVQLALRKLNGSREDDRQVIETLGRRLVNRLLHDPSVRLRKSVEHGKTVEYEKALKELFALEDRDV